MKNKKLILAVVALIAAAALFVGIYFITRPEAQQGSKTFTVTVVHADGTSKVFTCHTDEAYLAPAMVEAELIPALDESGMYNTIDGETASWEANRSYWGLYIGEDYAMTGANDTPVNDGDSFKWVYTIG